METLLKNPIYSFLHEVCVRVSLLSLLLSCLLLWGCAGGLAVSPDTQKIEINDKALVLIAVELDNEYKPGALLTPEAIELVRVDDPSGAPKPFLMPFIVTPEKLAKKGVTLSFLNFYLEPGSYEIIGLTGGLSIQAFGPGILSGGVGSASPRFYTNDFKAPFTARAGVVHYLGRFKASFVEKRSDDEPIALSQLTKSSDGLGIISSFVLKASGFHNATIKIVILDNHADDIPAFSSRYKALANIEIDSSAIPELTAPDFMKLVEKQADYSALRSTDFKTRINALKSLERSPTDDIEVYDFLNTKLMDSYMAEGDRNQFDELAWICKTLAASGLDKYEPSLVKVVENSNSSKVKRHCSESLSTLKAKKEVVQEQEPRKEPLELKVQQ